MKEVTLNDYEPNVSCPYCQEQGDISSSQWLVGKEMTVWQYCCVCQKAWQETWTLSKVEMAETAEEQETLDFLHRHPEAS